MSLEPTTNFKDSNGVDLGSKLVTKDYLISVYPEISQKIGIPPELWIWGTSENGALGAPSGVGDTPITTFSGGTNWKQVSVSSAERSSAAVKTDGTLWLWGRTFTGALGNGDLSVSISTPITTFAGGTDWKQVSSGGYHTSAIKTDGTLWLWGSGNNGKLGDGSTTGSISTPITTFAGGTDWKQVSCGNQHTAAIKTDGTLWTWGNGGSGRLGNADTTNKSTPVTTFAGGTDWKQVDVGQDYMAAIKTDGTLWTWGIGDNGSLGNADTTDKSTPVTTFAGGTNWKQVSCGGGRFMAAIKTDGTLWLWGANYRGQLGNASTSGLFATGSSTPITTFAGGTNWKQVDCGFRHVAVIKTDGTLWCWGDSYSTLGINFNSGLRSTPVTTFAGGTNWKQVSAGWQNTAAIKSVDFTAF